MTAFADCSGAGAATGMWPNDVPVPAPPTTPEPPTPETLT
jgi:hypothetical protein